MILNADQRAFLTIYPGTPADRMRASWLSETGAPLGSVADHPEPPPSAARVRAYRLSDGAAVSFRGAPNGQRILELYDLADLAHLWTVPLFELNAEGLALAEAEIAERAEGAKIGETFRLAGQVMNYRPPKDLLADLAAEVRRSGRTKTDVIHAALAAYLRPRQ